MLHWLGKMVLKGVKMTKYKELLDIFKKNDS